MTSQLIIIIYYRDQKMKIFPIPCHLARRRGRKVWVSMIILLWYVSFKFH